MISVVMPSYNSAPFIAEAITSVLAQTWPHFELLVCDDGSSDGTQRIVEEFARRDERVRLLQHGFRSVSLNCNEAIRQARFPWIARLDADDVMMKHRLEWQIKAAGKHPEVVLWGGYARLINRTGRILRTAWTGPATEEEFRRLRQAGRMLIIQGPTVMFRQDLALTLGGYDRRFDSAEDLEFLQRIADHGPVRVLPRALTLYRLHGSSVTASRAAHQQRLLRYIAARDAARVLGVPAPSLEEFMAGLDNAPAMTRALEWMDGRSRQHYRSASLHHAEGRVARAVGTTLLAVALNPLFSLPRIRARIDRALRWRMRIARRHMARLLGLRTALQGRQTPPV